MMKLINRKTLGDVSVFFILLLFSMISACNPHTPSSVTEQSLTRLPIKLSPTPRPEITTPSLSPEESDTSRLNIECVEVLDSIPDSLGLEGVLVLTDSLLNLESGESLALPTDMYKSGFTISPDRSKLAYILFEPHRVDIADSKNNVLKEFYDLDLYPLQWLDNTHLVLMESDHEESSIPPTMILDTENGELREIHPDFTDIHPNPDGIGYFWGNLGITKLSINPQMTYLVYPSAKPQESGYTTKLVLWDLKTNSEVTRFFVSNAITFPMWNNDGTRFVFGGYWDFQGEGPSYPLYWSGELVSVNTKGDIERLSYLTTKYEAFQHYPVWSPNGEFVAFWLDINFENDENYRYGLPSVPHQLAVIDVKTGSVTDYCIKGLGYPIWSPEGDFLAVRATHLDNNNLEYNDVKDIYIVDLAGHVVYKVTRGGYNDIAGWMVNEP